MDEITKEKIKLTSKEILISFVDASVKALEIFGYKYHRKVAREYFRERDIDKNAYYKKMWELEKRGYVRKYLDSKNAVYELTKKGQDKIKKYFLENIKIEYPDKWDKKWRIVIFDIPNKEKTIRDMVRRKLSKLGFLRLQESVFIFPFECKEIIDFIKNVYNASKYIQYILADRVETEVDLIDYFYENGVLHKKLF